MPSFFENIQTHHYQDHEVLIKNWRTTKSITFLSVHWCPSPQNRDYLHRQVLNKNCGTTTLVYKFMFKALIFFATKLSFLDCQVLKNKLKNDKIVNFPTRTKISFTPSSSFPVYQVLMKTCKTGASYSISVFGHRYFSRRNRHLWITKASSEPVERRMRHPSLHFTTALPDHQRKQYYHRQVQTKVSWSQHYSWSILNWLSVIDPWH